MPFAILNSIKSTLAVFEAVSAATIIEAAEYVSKIPKASTLSKLVVPYIAEETVDELFAV